MLAKKKKMTAKVNFIRNKKNAMIRQDKYGLITASSLDEKKGCTS